MKKQNHVGNIIVCSIMALLFTAVLVFWFAVNGAYMFGKEPEDLYDMIADGKNPEDEKDEFVKIDADAVVDWYAETTYKINGIIPAGKAQHCFLWLDGDAFISLTVKGKKNIEKIDELIDETQAFLNYESDELPTPVHLEGRLATIGAEVDEYYDDAMEAWGISASDRLTVYYVTIDTTDTRLKLWLMAGFFIALDALMVFTIISSAKKMKKEKAELANAPVYADTYDPYGLNAQNGAFTQNNQYAPNAQYDQNAQYNPNAPYGQDVNNNNPYQQ